MEILPMTDILRQITQAMEFQIQQVQAEVLIGDLANCVGDATQINQVFSNLLDNALKYRDSRRPPRVEVTAKREGDRVIYAVQDNGIGIPAEHQPKIFEIFHRLDGDFTGRVSSIFLKP